MLDIKVRVDGDATTIQRLEGLHRRVRRTIMRKGVSAGITPFIKAAKRSAPRDTGTLKKALVRKIKQYSANGVVWGAVGARNQRSEKDGRTLNPARYLHLVESGAKAHTIKPKKASRLVFTKNGRSVSVPSVKHPGMKGTKFIRRAFLASKPLAEHRFFSKTNGEITKVVLAAARKLN